MYFCNIVTEAMLRPDSNLLYLILIEGAPEANFHFNEKHMDAINCICNEDQKGQKFCPIKWPTE